MKLTGKAAERFTYMFLEMWNVSETKEENYEQYKTPMNFTMPVTDILFLMRPVLLEKNVWGKRYILTF